MIVEDILCRVGGEWRHNLHRQQFAALTRQKRVNLGGVGVGENRGGRERRITGGVYHAPVEDRLAVVVVGMSHRGKCACKCGGDRRSRNKGKGAFCLLFLHYCWFLHSLTLRPS